MKQYTADTGDIITYYPNYFNKKQCDDWISYCTSNFKPFHKTTNFWPVLVNIDSEFNKSLHYKLKDIVHWSEYYLSEIKLTTYTPTHYLRPHTDLRGELTIVINLNSGYTGGTFIAGGVSFNLGTGDVLSFKGGRVLHQVTPIITNTRYSLNTWIYPGKKKNLNLI